MEEIWLADKAPGFTDNRQATSRSFLPMPASMFRHTFWQGIHGRYSWLQSDQLRAADFFASTKLSREGCRLLLTWIDGKRPVASDIIYWLKKQGWQSVNNFVLSPILRKWPGLYWSDLGASLFVFQGHIESAEIESHFQRFADLELNQHLDDTSLKGVRQVWKTIDALGPEFYISDRGYLSVVAVTQVLQQFMSTAGFTRCELTI